MWKQGSIHTARQGMMAPNNNMCNHTFCVHEIIRPCKRLTKQQHNTMQLTQDSHFSEKKRAAS